MSLFICVCIRIYIYNIYILVYNFFHYLSFYSGSTYDDNINNVPTESFAGMISKSSTAPESEVH